MTPAVPRRIVVAAAVIRRGGKVLLALRPSDKPPAGLEFPGGKVEPGETPAEALRRELMEELGVDSVIGAELRRVDDGRIELVFLSADLPDGAIPVPREGQQLRWSALTPEPPPGLLPNDLEFWRFLASGTILPPSSPL